MIKKGKTKVCKRCELKGECLHVNEPAKCCIQVDRNQRKYTQKEIKK